MVPVGLIFRGFLAERAFNAFAELQLSPGAGAFEVGKAFPCEVFDIGKKGLQLLDALIQVVDGRGF